MNTKNIKIIASALVVLVLLQTSAILACESDDSAHGPSTCSAPCAHIQVLAPEVAPPSTPSASTSTLTLQPSGPIASAHAVTICYKCSGSGKCWNCWGSGKTQGVDCYMCSGGGKCYFCSGSGKQQ